MSVRYADCMAATRAIELRTELPGPRSREIGERLAHVVASPLAVTFPIIAASASGATLTDVDGNTFIDFAGGVGCLNVGHAHPDVAGRGARAARPLHPHRLHDRRRTSRTSRSPSGSRSARPISGPLKAAFFNAGTEAVENAVKFARAYTGRPAVIAFDGAFHGRTLLSLSLTSKVHPYKAGLGPFAPEVYRVPFPNEYRGITTEDALAALERAFTTVVAPETVAAIVFEPVQGEGGFIVAPAEFVHGPAPALRHPRHRPRRRRGADRLRPHRAVLRRSSTAGVEPDLICVAKSIASGLPLSGVIGRAEIMDAPALGGVGGTYVGNPVAQAAALAVLDVIDDEGLVERSAAIGETIRARMLAWQERWAGDRRRSRPRLDARDRARLRPRDPKAVEGARAPRDRGGVPARPAPHHLRRLRQLHPGTRAPRDLRRGARGGARRLGRRAGIRARLGASRSDIDGS